MCALSYGVYFSQSHYTKQISKSFQSSVWSSDWDRNTKV